MTAVLVTADDELRTVVGEILPDERIHEADDHSGVPPQNDVEVFVLGPDVKHPLRLTQGIFSSSGDVPVVIIAAPDAVEEIKGSLRFTPLIPSDTRCVSVADPGGLRQALHECLEMHRRREQHARTLAAISERVPTGPQRPVARSYLDRLLEVAPIGVLTLNRGGAVIEFNDRALEILRAGPGELSRRTLGDLFDDSVGVDRAISSAQEAVPVQEPVALKRTVNGSTRHIEMRIASLEDEDVDGVALALLLDVTDRVEAESARARAAAQIGFLAEASRRLSASLQLSEILERLASLAVPYLADWCAVDLVDREGNARRVSVRHKDPEKRAAAVGLRGYGPERGRNIPVVDVIDTRKPSVVDPVTPEALDAAAQNEEHRRLLDELGTKAALVVPLQARGRLLGTILLVRSGEGTHFGAADLAVAEDLCQRAALAMDNARLFQEHRHVARKLQESLLPPSLPDVPGLEIGARYCAAGEGIEVGGDFYDFFRLGPRSWGFVIGDVSGKGPEAAGVTALARYTARAAALQVRSVKRIFGLLNDALCSGTDPERFATLAFARVEVGSASPKKVVLASGGHPLPLVLRADGDVEELGETGTVLGLVDTIDVHEHTFQMHPGDTLLLFTDGVTEARGSDGRLLGGTGLRRLLRSCLGLGADAAAGKISEAVLEYQDQDPRDDLAVVVVRFPPASGPRATP